MADPRTFTLIGEFKDGITPELEKINRQLAALKANFSGIGSRKNTGFRGATQDIGKLVSAHKKLSESIKGVEGDLRSTVGVLQQYRREMGKAAAATRAFQKAGGRLGGDQFAKEMGAANRAAQEYLRTIRQINAESRRTPRGGMGGGFQPPRPPRGGGGYGGGMPGPGRTTPPSGGGGRGSTAGGGMGAHMAEFGFAYTLGNAISQPIQNAIVAGFQIGVGLMTKPFEYFANAFGERVQDQLSDLKAAGGLFSISKRSDTPFLKTIDEAIQYQQDTNRVFAKMAAALPGVTNDYVQVGKRLSDTMGRIAAGDFQNALQEANRIRATEEGRKFYGKEITGRGPEATKEVITTLLGEMTKKTTIAGLGGRSGAGGISGAYGLPGLTERMLSQQEVSMGQFQRYAAVFSDPTIQDALSRNVDLINKTLPNTTARFKAMQKLLDEVVTPDLIEKLRTSVDGIYQGLRSAILDPDTGLFGLGRQFENFGYKINQYGQYVVDKEGKKIKDSLSIFEIIADIFSNAGQAILPLVEALPLVFDPLKKVASILMDARHYAAEFNRTFNMYREGLKKLSETPGKDFLKDSLDVRASLSAVSNLLYQFGAIGKGEFESIGKQLLSKDLDIGGMLKGLLDAVLNSDIAKEIGATIGEIIGVVLSEVAGVTGFISGRIAKSNKLFEGIKAGFEKAGGPKALSAIFRDVFTSMLKALVSIGKLVPLEGYFLAGVALIMPAIAQGLGMKVGEEALKAIQKFGKIFEKGTGPALQKMKDAVKMFFDQFIAFFRNQMTRNLAVQQVTVRDLGANPPKALPPAGMPKALPPAGALAAPGVVRGMSAFAKFMEYVKGVGPRFLGFFKGIGGKLTILGGVITTFISLFEGKNLAESLAQGAGPVLGAALGAALVPFFGPIGPMIGSLIGGWIGSMEMVTQPLTEIFSSLGGALAGLKDSVGMILTLTGDLFGELFQLIAGFAGVKGEVDGFKIALAPITLTLQALELGLKGFALLLAEMRVFFKRFFGSSKEYQEAIAERDRLNASLKESQGRINAYNASMLGTANLQKQVNDAQYELINGGKKLTEARKKELVAFIESAKKLDKEIKLKKDVVVKTKEKTEEKKAQAPAKKDAAKAPAFWEGLKTTLSEKWNQFSSWFSDGINSAWNNIKSTIAGKWSQFSSWFLKGIAQTWEDIKSGKIFFNLAHSLSQAYTKVQEAISSTISRINAAWTQFTGWVSSLPGKLQTAYSNAVTTLNGIWSRFTNWVMSLPGKLQTAYSNAVAALNNLWSQFTSWVSSLPGKLRTALTSALSGLQQAWATFTAWFSSLPGKLRNAVTTAFSNMGNLTTMLANGIKNWLKNSAAQALAGWKAGQKPKPGDPKVAQAKGSPGVAFGSLGSAVAYEQQHKPAGSDLVVANTSETVIPAAGGYGMTEFMDTLKWGFSTMISTYRQAQQKQDAMLTSINQTLKLNQQQTNTRLAAMEKKFSAPSMPGGLGGASAGGVDAFTPIAQKYGLQMTSGYRPGDPGWHGANRARDFSNGTGPTPQMMQFAQYMASAYGSNLKELIYTPLGFSIKNGQQVPPYAQGSHYNHVHVAYALGQGQGVAFNSLKGAQNWENSMVPGSVRVASVTGNSSEGFGSNTSVVNNITINQQPGQDSDELASIVAMKISEAVSDARAASIFV